MKTVNTSIIFFLLSISLLGCTEKTIQKKGEDVTMLAGKNILMIIAKSNFRDEEFEVPYQLFKKEGAKIIIASSSLNISKGMLGKTIKPDALLSQINIDNFNAVIFIGGSGASEYWNDPTAHNIAKNAIIKGKILAAICIAPVTLANAGILSGKKATVFSSEIGPLRAKGAILSNKDVEIDGNIITASGPTAAFKFGETIIKELCKK
ncbi:MAG: DJ-1/PfpI family protein [bacterium]|nr:DJ-1/PfpI family protein [bacterium]